MNGLKSTRDENIKLLAAVSWDLRASAEAQLRALTSLQRCLDEYSNTHDQNALREIMEHVSTVDERVLEVQTATAVALTTVATLLATHT
jgi:hypothetical protein